MRAVRPSLSLTFTFGRLEQEVAGLAELFQHLMALKNGVEFLLLKALTDKVKGLSFR